MIEPHWISYMEWDAATPEQRAEWIAEEVEATKRNQEAAQDGNQNE